MYDAYKVGWHSILPADFVTGAVTMSEIPMGVTFGSLGVLGPAAITDVATTASGGAGVVEGSE